MMNSGYKQYKSLMDVSSVLRKHATGRRAHSSGVQAQGVPGHAGSVDLSSRTALMIELPCMARGVLGIINTVYTVVGVLNFHLIVKDVIRLKTGLNSLGHRRSNRIGAAYI